MRALVVRALVVRDLVVRLGRGKLGCGDLRIVVRESLLKDSRVEVALWETWS